MKFKNSFLFTLVLFTIVLCSAKVQQKNKNVQIAFIADAHFQDIHAHFKDANYKGIKNPETGEFVNIRTMNSQLRSTRLFNENYFSLIAALDDIVARGIKYVALPGDFSDDGQPIHVKGLRKLLEKYTNKYGILFFATTGNHDPVKPFSHDAGKIDFLGKEGKEQIITSSQNNIKNKSKEELEPIVTSEIKKWGYKEILNQMSLFGFYPQKEYVYWETPFTTYDYKNYSLEKAQEQSVLSQRVYAVDEFNKHPDASYLVEPTSGVWLLAIDANVYMLNKKTLGFSENAKDFSGASIGYNHVLIQKTHLINWVKKVAKQAKEKGKVLIGFSHYPMVDFNDDASSEMKHFFGENKMQLHRVPKEQVAETFADAGIQIHFGGHMHINDTGVRTSKKGNTLFNIQSPSLAAYMPAYKILSINSKTDFEVETVVIDSVTNFNSLFSLYRLEHQYLKNTKSTEIWNPAILQAKNYKDFTAWHLKELVRLRFLPSDWPILFSEKYLKLSGKELLFMNKVDEIKVKNKLMAENLPLEDFDKWTGFEMIYDFYRLRSADELALPEIGEKRLKQYDLLCEELKKSEHKLFRLWADIYTKTKNGLPADHFKINLKSKKIERINHYF